jgi:heme exporter protein A
MSQQNQAYPADNRLSLQQISALAGTKLLFDNISVEVSSGELLHIAGANGAGKSTLLNIITGLAEAETGQVYWNQQALAESASFKQDLSYIGHKDGLKQQRSVIENLRFYQRLYQSDVQNLDQLLHDFDLLDVAELVTGQLSFGQRRRLALARLSLAKRPLWVLDEPFTGVDVTARDRIEQLFEQHLQAAGMIVMTHHGSFSQTNLVAYQKQLLL